MAKNITYKPGDHLPAPVPSGTKSGAPLRLGGLNAIAITDRAKTDVSAVNADGSPNTSYNAAGGNTNGNASVWFEGAATVKVTSGAAPTFGQPVYFVTADSTLTTTATGNSLWGHAVDTAPVNNGDGTFQTVVRVNN